MEQTRKHSKKRDAILECICATDTHPSAEWVYQQLKSRIPNLSLATVYRNIALFKAEGRVTSVGVVRGLERFDGRTEPHAHFICAQCGSIRDLQGIQVPQELSQEAARIADGQVTGCTFCFEGLCSACTLKSIPNRPMEKPVG